MRDLRSTIRWNPGCILAEPLSIYRRVGGGVADFTSLLVIPLNWSQSMNKEIKVLSKPVYGVFLSVLVAGIQSTHAASFNCSKASNVIESLVCKDSSLSKKDSQMANLYKKALKDLPRSMQRGLRDEQRDWLSERDSCDDRECLELVYSKRIYELKHYFE